MAKNPERPSYVTKKDVKDWQPYVGSVIRRQINKGVAQEEAVEHALDLRDKHIKDGDKAPRYGRKSNG